MAVAPARKQPVTRRILTDTQEEKMLGKKKGQELLT